MNKIKLPLKVGIAGYGVVGKEERLESLQEVSFVIAVLVTAFFTELAEFKKLSFSVFSMYIQKGFFSKI